MEDYKKALYYLGKIDRINASLFYTETEQMLVDKVLKTIENEEIRKIINNTIYSHFHLAKKFLQDYIEEQEKKDDKEN